MNLVTGSTGLVGLQILRDLVAQQQSVRAMIHSKGNHMTLQALKKEMPGVEWVEGDVLDVYSLEEAMKGISNVYHCAGFVSFDKKEEPKMHLVNAKGTENVVNMALETGIKKMAHISSIAALGRAGTNETITEETHWTESDANTAYAISKYSAEREVWRGVAEGLDAVIVNPSVILGAGDWKKSSGKLFLQIWKGLPFYSEGINGFVDVRDVSSITIRLMQSDSKNERYILNSENLSYKRLFEEIAAGLGKSAPRIHVPAWVSGLVWRAESFRTALTGGSSLITKETARMASGKYYYANEKIKKKLGVSFIPVTQSIREVCEVFLREMKKN